MAVELPRFVVAAIENAAAGSVEDKVAWLNSQRSIMSDEEARARAEAVLGDIPDDDWKQLQVYADQAQAKEAPPEPFYGAPEGWRYSLVTGELVPEQASVEQLVALQTDQGLTAEQLAAEAERAAIIQVAQLPIKSKVDFLVEQLQDKSNAQVRAEVEAVLGPQDDKAWKTLTALAESETKPVILKPPISPGDTKPIDQGKNIMVQSVGNVPLPSNWDTFSAQQKITWFNVNKITPEALKAAGVADADIVYMRQNGYVVGITSAQQPQGAGLPLILAAAAYFLIGG